MKQYRHYIVMLTGLIAIFCLYNQQLASVPLLLLSAYLFTLFFIECGKIKNNK